MVYYPVSRQALFGDIRVKDKHWLNKAAIRTRANVNANALIMSNSIWSSVKSVYMERQFDKCVYCEFPLGGRSTQDVEHFRPKSKISTWPKTNTYPFATGTAQNSGYYWLAYDPLNYAASCKDCNSALKRDTFPILGKRGPATRSVVALNRSEKPLLLFPFGDWGDNPAEYFEYDGIFVRPKNDLARIAAQRAQVTIDFFQLNKRRNLLRARHTVIGLIWANVELRETSKSPATVARAERTILENIIDQAPHALCARSFLELMQTDPARATNLGDEARTHLMRLGYLTIGSDA